MDRTTPSPLHEWAGRGAWPTGANRGYVAALAAWREIGNQNQENPANIAARENGRKNRRVVTDAAKNFGKCARKCARMMGAQRCAHHVINEQLQDAQKTRALLHTYTAVVYIYSGEIFGGIALRFCPGIRA